MSMLSEKLSALVFLAKAHPDHIGQSETMTIGDLYTRVVENGDRLDAAEAQVVNQLFEDYSYLMI